MPYPNFTRRGATKGIWDSMPRDLIFRLYDYIEVQLEQGLDVSYHQIFELSEVEVNGNRMQRLVHRQERPELRAEYILSDVKDPINLTAWVIDEGTQAFMMLPEEFDPGRHHYYEYPEQEYKSPSKETVSVALYARTPAMGRDEFALNQIEELLQYADNKGCKVTKVFIDNGQFSNLQSRPALNKMLADCKRGEFDEVLIVEPSCIGRNPVAYVYLKSMLAQEWIPLSYTKNLTAQEQLQIREIEEAFPMYMDFYTEYSERLELE